MASARAAAGNRGGGGGEAVRRRGCQREVVSEHRFEGHDGTRCFDALLRGLLDSRTVAPLDDENANRRANLVEIQSTNGINYR